MWIRQSDSAGGWSHGSDQQKKRVSLSSPPPGSARENLATARSLVRLGSLNPLPSLLYQPAESLADLVPIEYIHLEGEIGFGERVLEADLDADRQGTRRHHCEVQIRIRFRVALHTGAEGPHFQIRDMRLKNAADSRHVP
jgi:hypothetical protein